MGRKTWAPSPLYEVTVKRQLEASKSGSRFSLRTEPAGALILDLPASRTGRNKCLLFKPQVYGTLLKQPALTKMEVHMTEMERKPLQFYSAHLITYVYSFEKVLDFWTLSCSSCSSAHLSRLWLLNVCTTISKWKDKPQNGRKYLQIKWSKRY